LNYLSNNAGVLWIQTYY